MQREIAENFNNLTRLLQKSGNVGWASGRPAQLLLKLITSEVSKELKMLVSTRFLCGQMSIPSKFMQQASLSAVLQNMCSGDSRLSQG